MQITRKHISLDSKQSTKNHPRIYGQVHHDAVHIKQGEKMIITHSEAKFG